LKRFEHLELNPSKQPAERATAKVATGLPLGGDEDRDWIQRADQERREGHFDNALRLYSRALEIDKSIVAGWAGQVQMLIALEEYPEAELWSRKALELFKNNPALLAGRARAQCRLGEFAASLKTCDAAISQQGLEAAPWIARGELLLAQKQQTEGHCFDKAIQLDRDWLIPLEIGWIYLHYGYPAKALPRFRTASEQASSSAFCWYSQGHCEARMGMGKFAQRSFQTCLTLAPNHSLARQELKTLKTRPDGPFGLLRRLFKGE
jgi:tetratricopeptide (TPR) repeat protein